MGDMGNRRVRKPWMGRCFPRTHPLASSPLCTSFGGRGMSKIAYRRKEVIGDCTLYLGDCMEIMPTLGKVQAVLTDPPYGMTDASWDNAPNVEAMWRELKLDRTDAVFILNASQPFTSAVVLGNIKDFRVEWIW